jgi:hypothetical protein
MKNDVFWDVTPCGPCKNRRLEERIASIIRVRRIGEQLLVTKQTCDIIQNQKRTSRLSINSSEKFDIEEDFFRVYDAV